VCKNNGIENYRQISVQIKIQIGRPCGEHGAGFRGSDVDVL
jgi:hypothetical protein